MKLWVHQSAATFGAITRRPLRAIRRQITTTRIFLGTAPSQKSTCAYFCISTGGSSFQSMMTKDDLGTKARDLALNAEGERRWPSGGRLSPASGNKSMRGDV